MVYRALKEAERLEGKTDSGLLDIQHVDTKEEEVVPSLKRSELYRGLTRSFQKHPTLLKNFLCKCSVPVEFPDFEINFATAQERASLYPNEFEISKNFASHNHATKGNKQVSRRSLILGVEHRIGVKTLLTYFGRHTFKGQSEIIIEDILTTGKNKSDRITSQLIKNNINGSMHAISAMPQQNYFLKDIKIVPIKKEFEGVRVELGFDFRSLMLTLGMCLGQYLSKGEIKLDYSNPASKKINTTPNTLVGRGELIFTSSCGVSDLELNTFCVLAGISGASVVLLFSERVSISDQVLKGISLYDYICRLIRNIIYTADLFSCSAEHFWALMCGMHKVLKVYSHTDEGGAFRRFLTAIVTPPPQGVIYEAERDILGVQPNLYEISPIDKRTLLDWLLFFPNATAFSDSGIQNFSEFIPTILSRHPNSPKTLGSYRGFTCAAVAVINNIMQILRKVFCLTHSIHKADFMYKDFSPLDTEDRHCDQTVIAPFVWLDPALSNVYNLSHLFRKEKLSYYSKTTLPFFPPDTTFEQSNPREINYMQQGTHLKISLPQHCMRNYGYSFILNPRYNIGDGLGELIVEEKNDIASQDFLNSNFLFTNGDPIVGKNKWTTPNCTIPNYHEFLPLLDRYTLALFSSREDYYPTAPEFFDGTVESQHLLGRLTVKESCVKRCKSGKFVPKAIELSVRNSIDFLYKTAEIDEPKETVYPERTGGARGIIKESEKLPASISQIGDALSKINYTQKSLTSEAQLVIDGQKIKTVATINRPADDSSVVKTKDEGKSIYTQSATQEDLLSQIENKVVLTPVSKSPIIKEEISLGDKSFPEVKIRLLPHSSSEADTPYNLVPPSTWDYSEAEKAEQAISKIIADPTLKEELYEDFLSFKPLPGQKCIPNDKLDDSWEAFVNASIPLLKERGLKPLGVSLLSFCGEDPAKPDLRLWRALTLGVSGKFPHYRYPIKIANITKIGNSPAFLVIQDFDNNEATYRQEPAFKPSHDWSEQSD